MFSASKPRTEKTQTLIATMDKALELIHNDIAIREDILNIENLTTIANSDKKKLIENLKQKRIQNDAEIERIEAELEMLNQRM